MSFSLESLLTNDLFINDESEFETYFSNNKDNWKAELSVDESSYFYNSPQAESIITGNQKVLETHKAPFRFVCKLIINLPNRRQLGGTGILISPKHVLTAGHCILPVNSGVATSIDVIPGLSGRTMPFGKQTSRNFNVSKKWRKRKNRNFDYGIITLPDTKLFNRVRGHFVLDAATKNVKNIIGGGYIDSSPIGVEDPVGVQAITYGKVIKYYRNSLSFTNELKVGYSGGPIYFKRKVNNKRFYSIIGLGCYLYVRNFGPRVTSKMLKELKEMTS